MPLHKFNNPGLAYYRAMSQYLELAQEIPEVAEVRLAEDDTLYTIISAPSPDDSVAYQVFGAEGAVMRSVKPQPFLFHLLNDQAPGIQDRAAYNRSHGDLVWARHTDTESHVEGTVKASKLNNPGLVYYQALSKYLELVREIPEVVEVRLSDDDKLYAIISATPYDDGPCYQVYRAEGKVMDAVSPQPYRFRLVNAQELPLDGRDDQIRSFGDLVWKR